MRFWVKSFEFKMKMMASIGRKVWKEKEIKDFDKHLRKYKHSTVEAALCDHFGPDQSDNIKQMITIADDVYLAIYSKWDYKMWLSGW